MPAISTAIDVFMTYRFLRTLTTDWTDMKAYELGIIDDQGNILKKRKDLESTEEREAYTLFDRLVWKLKRLLGKVPGGKSMVASYAAALWLIKENASHVMHNPDLLEEAFVEYVQEKHGFKPVKTIDTADVKVLTPGKYNVLGEDVQLVDTGVSVGDCLGYDLYELYIDNEREIVTYEDFQRNNG